MAFRVRRLSITRVALAVVLLSVILQASSCPNTEMAKNKVRSRIISIFDQLENPPLNWRVHWMLLKKKTEISSFDFFSSGGLETYTCAGWCVVFFLDLNPYAHFAHPTQLFVYDSEPADESKPIVVFEPTEWWPTIREESWDYPRSIFDTVAKREDPLQVFILDRPRELPLPTPPIGFRFNRLALYRGIASGVSGPPPTPTLTPPPATATTVDTCDTGALPVWAILVNGFYDESDTFDEDIVGMYSVLRGFGVDDDRIRCLSSFGLFDSKSCENASLQDLNDTFDLVLEEMTTCSQDLPATVNPHFLLFWSSHGGTNALACDLSINSRELVFGSKLDEYVSGLEGQWMSPDTNLTRLETTIVIEACKSGTVGTTLNEGGAHRRILTSARGQQDVSYRDIDIVDGQIDPNPADAGSETIWGYVEAFGSESVDTSGDGKTSFDEAVQYAKDNDVSILGGLHEIAVWTPVPANPTPVHGAWNTTVRTSSTVAFSSPASTAAALVGNPVTVDVVPGQNVNLELEIKNSGGVPEVGALALRLFRNDETADDKKWTPKYYAEDDLRTTLMIPGLEASQSVLEEGSVDIPGSFQEGDSIRVVVTLDSGQPTPTPADAAAITEAPKSEIVLKVKKKCKSICCWWRDLWD